MLQYNRLYQSLKKVSAEWHAGHVQWSYTWFYLKFFENNRFIYALFTNEDFDSINKGFNEKSIDKDFLRGTFGITDGYTLDLTFDNKIKISGAIIDNDKVILNGKMSWELYTVI